MYDLTMFSKEERLIFFLSKNKRLSFCEDDESLISFYEDDGFLSNNELSVTSPFWCAMFFLIAWP